MKVEGGRRWTLDLVTCHEACWHKNVTTNESWECLRLKVL